MRLGLIERAGLSLSLAAALGLPAAAAAAANNTASSDDNSGFLAFLIMSVVIITIWFYKRKRTKKIRLDEFLKQSHADKLRAEARAAAAEQEYRKSRREEDARQRAIRWDHRQKINALVDKHHAALVRNLERAMRENDYGAIVEDHRYRVLVEFYGSVDIDEDLLGAEATLAIVQERLQILDELQRGSDFNPNDLPDNGIAFEHWVAASLCRYGWDARVTVASGDQGIDVIASQNGHRLGLQCKLYNSAVGNKSVQEAHAGKAYHAVDMVAVMSNAVYTTSAKSLAVTTGVILLSPHDIPTLYDKVFPSLPA